MSCWLAVFFCLLQLVSRCEIPVKALVIPNIQSDANNVTTTCDEDSCDYNATGLFSSRSCHCEMFCVQLGTCCFDSAYVDIPQTKIKPSCRSIYNGEHYYVVDRCPSTDSVWTSLCNTDWDGDNDVRKLVPVTSIFTSKTYKNYYCFRCHESNNDFLYWVVKIESDIVQRTTSSNESKQSNEVISLTYNKDEDTWMATYDEEIGYFPVTLSMQIPERIRKLVHSCQRDVISDCSEEWYDEEVKYKCQSYMALKEVKNNGTVLKYKNIHCAACNFENLNDISCVSPKFIIHAIPAMPDQRRRPFSFTYLLDINRSDGELVGKIQRCPDEDQTWDPYTNKCRKLTCALPGYKVRNYKCVKE